MKLSQWLLKIAGWKVDVTIPDFPKSIICVAPHTSNWDFILGKLAYSAVGRKTGFLMKETWFFFPLGPIFKAMGGIPVPRKRGSDLSQAIVDKINNAKRITIAITPEGTRSLTHKWRSGFLHIARGAGIPIQLAVLDYANKHIYIHDSFSPTDDIENDMRRIKDYYKGIAGKKPEKFSTR